VKNEVPCRERVSWCVSTRRDNSLHHYEITARTRPPTYLIKIKRGKKCLMTRGPDGVFSACARPFLLYFDFEASRRHKNRRALSLGRAHVSFGLIHLRVCGRETPAERRQARNETLSESLALYLVTNAQTTHPNSSPRLIESQGDHSSIHQSAPQSIKFSNA